MSISTYVRKLQQALRLAGSAWKSGYDDLWRPTGFERPLPVMQFDHIYTHAGRIFISSHLWPSTAKLADAATAEYLIQVGANSHAHTVIQISAEGSVELTLLEGPTFSAAGTGMTQFNSNRTSVNTSDTTITHTPTVSVDGTQLNSKLLPGGSGPHSAGGSGSFDHEWIFENDTDYLIQIKNVSGGAASISIEIDIIEVPIGVEMW